MSFIVKLESHSPKDALCKSLTKIGRVVLGKKTRFLNLFMNFRYFVIMWGGGGGGKKSFFFLFLFLYFFFFFFFCFFFFLWGGGGGGLKKKLFFFNFVHVYLLFRYFLLLEKNGGLYSCKLESHECFLPSLVKIGSVVLEKIFKFRQYIFTF